MECVAVTFCVDSYLVSGIQCVLSFQFASRVYSLSPLYLIIKMVFSRQYEVSDSKLREKIRNQLNKYFHVSFSPNNQQQADGKLIFCFVSVLVLLVFAARLTFRRMPSTRRPSAAREARLGALHHSAADRVDYT